MNNYMNIKTYKIMICQDIVIVISQYIDYIDRINIAKLNRNLYKHVNPKIRYVIYYHLIPSNISKNLYICETKEDAM